MPTDNPILEKEEDIKLAELIIYTSGICASDRTFGLTKMNKVLFHIDFLAYLNNGKSVTERKYIKQKFGPVPQLVHVVLDDLVKYQRILISEIQLKSHPMKKVFALDEPNLDVFTGSEMEIVHEVLDRWKDVKTGLAVDWSHTFIGWQVAEINEVIPYGIVLASNPEAFPHELEKAKELDKYVQGRRAG